MSQEINPTANYWYFRHYGSYKRLPALLENANSMDETTWLNVLGDIWSSCDNIGLNLKKLLESPFGVRLKNKTPIREMMNSSELAAYDALPSEVTVYRGCYQNNKCGLSWTLEETLAIKFTKLNRYSQTGQAILLEAKAKKKKIAAIKLDRSESEIITWKPVILAEGFIK